MAVSIIPVNATTMLLLLLLLLGSAVAQAPETPAAPAAAFVFGDSTADVGTNNHLNTKAKANFPYNGIDYPYHIPTGRFSNGLNTVDQIARLMGLNRSPPPYLALVNRSDTFTRNILNGVNFASGGSGILFNTGRQFGQIVSMREQIEQFATVAANITQVLGRQAGAALISRSIFLLSVGGNDMFEYFGTPNQTIPPRPYSQLLLSTYLDHLQHLYNLGARIFGLIGVPPIGCCPAKRLSSGCDRRLNGMALTFYSSLELALKNWSSQVKDVKYSFGNAYEMTMTIIENPLAFKMDEVKTACCGMGDFNGAGPCEEAMGARLCSDRHKYLFWDWYHPTEAASELAALTLYGGSQRFVTPMNFSRLIN